MAEVRNLVRVDRFTVNLQLWWLAVEEVYITIPKRRGGVGIWKLQKPFLQLLRGTCVNQDGKYRWGKSAESVAGASICIALREAGKAETVREVAVHIQCREDQLARVYRHLTTKLNTKFEPLDPALLVPPIWSYTQSCITASPASGPFPPELVKFINELAPRSQAVLNLTLQLSNLILRLSLTQGRQPPLVACALLIVSLSGEAGKPVPKPAVLSSALSERFGGTRRGILDRVREIERVIEDWKQELPWTGSNVPLNQRKRTTMVSQYIKDVVHFKDDLWAKQIEAVDHARYSPSVDATSDDELDDSASCTESSTGSKRSDANASSTGSSKRRRLDSGYYDSGRPRAYVVEPLKQGATGRIKTLALSLSQGDRLHASRHIRDEDLFGEGELEGLMRTPHEVEALRSRWEEEKRFEGVPEWTEDSEEALLSMYTFLEKSTPPPDCGEEEEVIGQWRDASPSGFGDDSYFDEGLD
ncbi:hypothetical protein RhiLY_14153 [Ceratobasidium sp. AG-Ba]|nr:hypothetical protein RhiLY_14153 [Ceratobasidium sp. AG-Ba]